MIQIIKSQMPNLGQLCKIKIAHLEVGSEYGDQIGHLLIIRYRMHCRRLDIF